MQRVRSGPSLAEFLGYYILVLLDKHPATQNELVRAIKEHSADNRNYRRQGVLWVASAEMKKALTRLESSGFIQKAPQNQWNLTDEGRRELANYESVKQQETNGKEQATDLLIKLLGPVESPYSVLDVGTGEGYLAFKLAEQGFRVTGIDSGAHDYSRESLAKARQQARENGIEAQFVSADVMQLAEGDLQYDFIVSSDAVHCMKDQLDCLRAIFKLLRPGGKWLCLDLAVGLKGFFVHGFHAFLALSPEEWQQRLPQIGFHQVQIHYAGDYLVVEADRPIEA